METVVSGSDIHAERVAVCDVEAHGKHALTFSSICLYGFGGCAICFCNDLLIDLDSNIDFPN